MAQAALKVLTISIRHLLPMNELDRGIFSFFPPDPALPLPPLSLPPPPHAPSAAASTTASPATRAQRPALRTPAPPSPARVRRGSPTVAPRPDLRVDHLIFRLSAGEANERPAGRQAASVTGAGRARGSRPPAPRRSRPYGPPWPPARPP